MVTKLVLYVGSNFQVLNILMLFFLRILQWNSVRLLVLY